MPSVAILGASPNRAKFGNKAVRAYLDKGWTVYPVHPKAARVEGLIAFPSISALPGPPDRVALYLPPKIAIGLLAEIAQSGKPVLYVNPGAGSPELFQQARELGIETLDACAILAIGAHPSSYGDN